MLQNYLYAIVFIVHRTPGIGYNPESNSGNPFNYFTTGVACSEVEIDCLTGDHKVGYKSLILLLS